LEHGSISSSGFGEVPAVQTSVLVRMALPSLNSTPRSETPVTLVLIRISTWRAANFLWA
jgi:hypothetical protein